MTTAHQPRRRRVLRAALGAGLLSGLGLPMVGRAAASQRVVIAGGGFAGATCALALRRFAPKLDIVLVDRQARFVTGPFCNTVISGLNPLSAITQNHAGLTAAGVKVIHTEIDGVDTAARTVHLADGRRLTGDRVILGPGIDFRWETIDGYGPEAAERIPFAWPGGAHQLRLLRDQLRAMPDNGRVLISVPDNPYRCPPGPYERASLIAWFVKQHKRKAKVLILDAKDHFVKEALFRTGWGEHYPDTLHWRGRADDGRVVAVDAPARAVHTAGGDELHADVINIIPSQQAGRLAADAGLATAAGWVPVAAHDFSLPGHPGIHVIGDACDAPPMPKSGYAANMQAKICALGIATELAGAPTGDTVLINACYSLITPDDGISITDVYKLKGDSIGVIENAGGMSALAAGPPTRAAEAAYAKSWYQNIVKDSFG